MLITTKLGNLQTFALQGRQVDYLELEWFETTKRILHKTTVGGTTLQMKFLQSNPQFQPGDVIFTDDHRVIVIEIAETNVIAILPKTMLEMAAICYEIGNKHLPLFYEGAELLVAYDHTLFTFLQAAGYHVQKAKRKLTNVLKTTVAPHNDGGRSLFNRIMQLTKDPE